MSKATKITRRLFPLALAVLLTISLAACGGKATETTTPTPPAESEEISPTPTESAESQDDEDANRIVSYAISPDLGYIYAPSTPVEGDTYEKTVNVVATLADGTTIDLPATEFMLVATHGLGQAISGNKINANKLNASTLAKFAEADVTSEVTAIIKATGELITASIIISSKGAGADLISITETLPDGVTAEGDSLYYKDYDTYLANNPSTLLNVKDQYGASYVPKSSTEPKVILSALDTENSALEINGTMSGFEGATPGAGDSFKVMVYFNSGVSKTFTVHIES